MENRILIFPFRKYEKGRMPDTHGTWDLLSKEYFMECIGEEYATDDNKEYCIKLKGETEC